MAFREIDIDSGEDVIKEPDAPTSEEQQAPLNNPGIEIGPDVQIVPVVPDGHIIEQDIRRRQGIIIQIRNN
ncbi:hypothetical protein ACFL10_01005 [Patescibacteria group bacterium]